MRDFQAGEWSKFHPNVDNQGRFGVALAQARATGSQPELIEGPSGTGRASARGLARIM